MLSLVYISASSPLPGASYTTQGALVLSTSQPLARNTPLLVYNRSLLRAPTVKEQAVQVGWVRKYHRGKGACRIVVAPHPGCNWMQPDIICTVC